MGKTKDDFFGGDGFPVLFLKEIDEIVFLPPKKKEEENKKTNLSAPPIPLPKRKVKEIGRCPGWYF